MVAWGGERVPSSACGTVTDRWRRCLKDGGYEPPRVTWHALLRFRLLSRIWRRILRGTGLPRGGRVRALEFGCGGGAQLIPLAVNGWLCTGVDCSEHVLARARLYLARVRESGCPVRGAAEFECVDFLDYDPGPGHFDLTFAFGVLEHFLVAEERVRYLRKMFHLTRPGGYVVSAVPNGRHPLRHEQRKKGLGGYNIPEIDYSRELLLAEMKSCGASSVAVLPHDLFGYLKLSEAGRLAGAAKTLTYYLLQFPGFQLLPQEFLDRHAYWWIAIARKAGSGGGESRPC